LRIHAQAPLELRGAGWAAFHLCADKHFCCHGPPYRSTSATRALYQFMITEVSNEKVR
jgi:hypothetical protein